MPPLDTTLTDDYVPRGLLCVKKGFGGSEQSENFSTQTIETLPGASLVRAGGGNLRACNFLPRYPFYSLKGLPQGAVYD